MKIVMILMSIGMIYGEFSMGDYSYTASEILYNNDISAYKSEYNSYKADELNNNEK